MKFIPAYFPRWSGMVLLLLLLGCSFLYTYDQILFMRPQTHHVPRQTDCLSLTLNYYRGNADLFHPYVNACDSNGNLKGITECPIIYYSVALLWKLFGYHEYIYRLVVLLLFFASLYALMKMAERLLENSLWSLLFTVFVFSTPVLIFYANNFLMDVPALSCAIIGWSFFMGYGASQRSTRLCWAFVFFTLATLLKISSAISVVALGVIFLLELSGKFSFGKDGAKMFRSRLTAFIVFATYGLISLAWYYYSVAYSRQHHCGLFLTGTLPVWGLDKPAIMETARLLFAKLDREMFNTGGFYFSLMILFPVLFSRVLPSFFRVITAVLLVSFLVYLVLFFQVFNVHDYYLVNMYIFFVFVFLSGFLLMKERYPAFFSSGSVFLIGLLFTGWSVYESTVKVRWTYYAHDPIAEGSPLISKEDKDFYGWYHWYHDAYLSAFNDIEPYNRKLGIKREDMVISIQDVTPQLTLYLMDQRGFTSFGYSNPQSRETMDSCIAYGARYLFLFDSAAIYDKPFIQPYIHKRMGAYKNILIYDLHPVADTLLRQRE